MNFPLSYTNGKGQTNGVRNRSRIAGWDERYLNRIPIDGHPYPTGRNAVNELWI
jgi:hypothetical protein